MKKFIILAAILLTACSSTKSLNVQTYKQAAHSAKQQWLANRENTQYEEYLNVWDNFNNENKLDERDGCYSYGRKPVKIILVINNEGLVENVFTQAENEKTKCFVKSYTGVTFPKPPVAPFYQLMTMN